MIVELSSDKAFWDFLLAAERHPLRVLLERQPVPRKVRRVREYDAETERLLFELRVSRKEAA